MIKYKKTSADINPFRMFGGAIHGKYLCDEDRAYCDGLKLQNVSSWYFVVFNRCFAGERLSIFTVYGNAKVKYPLCFEVLDDGNVNNDDIYVSGYGRDDVYMYWFIGSTGTGHATVVRSCKKPHTFRSIKSGYGIDDDYVYYEAVKIPKANPKTWTMINNNYSKDD
ncbi:DKNYY domain-containing protein [Acidithiobacillus sp.]|uniref:DKNYY domain-containing protein n=1 Tax=Acidithiobacillus sp. TaxID=1872118 RepID=UPI003D052C1D